MPSYSVKSGLNNESAISYKLEESRAVVEEDFNPSTQEGAAAGSL